LRLLRARANWEVANPAHEEEVTPSHMGVGASSGQFTSEELEEYEAVTCLAGSEVIDLHGKFVALGGVKASAGEGADDAETGGVPSSAKKVPLSAMLETEELKNNPFGRRLCEVFSTEPAFSPTWGDLAFDEFVDMYSCLSPRATKEVKMQTAFRMYDFDNNGYLTTEDLEWLLKTLSTPPPKKGKERSCLFKPEEINDIVERVMRDCDVDGNHRLSYAEFSKVLSRIPGFCTKFSIPIS